MATPAQKAAATAAKQDAALAARAKDAAKQTTIDPKFGQGPGTVKPPKSSGAGQLPIKPGKPKVEKPILLEEPTFPEAGTIIGYQPGVNGMRIPIYANGKGGTFLGEPTKDTSITTPEARVLASDTFANTFALVFGSAEAAQPYVKALYNLTSGFYKSGSTMDEAMNLAIRQARVDKTIPEFTKRFNGIFALEDRQRAGEAITVPTIDEFIKSEQEAGDLLRQAGMADLATQEFLGDVLGQGKSVAEIGRIVNNAFNLIDNAPKELKDTLSLNFPTATRIGLAKALIGGPKGAAALEQEIKSYSIVSAAQQMGLSQTYSQAQELAKQGLDYSSALTGFGQVAAALPGYEKVLETQRGGDVTTAEAQASLEKAILQKNALEMQKINQAAMTESAKFAGSSGTMGSKSLASQARGAGLI